jgi:hypothetical protein
MPEVTECEGDEHHRVGDDEHATGEEDPALGRTSSHDDRPP